MPVSAKIAVIVACIFWAASFIATKTALDIIPPLTVVTLRLLVSSTCFGIFLWAKRQPIRIHSRKYCGQLVLLSLFGTGLHYGLQTIGIGYTTASNASLYAVTGPISIVIISALFLGEKITRKKGFGIFSALVGVIIVMGLSTLREFDFWVNFLGDSLVIVSIFMWGAFTVMGKRMTERVGAIELSAAVTFIGTLYMIPVGILEIQTSGFSLASVTVEAWIAVGFLGLTCSFLATLLYLYGLTQTESQKVGVYLYTIPPMTYVFASIYLGESITMNLLIGTAVVIFGVYVTEKG